MGKIVLLVAREEMLYQAHNILQEKKYRIAGMRAIRTEDTVMEARQEIRDGATVLIARGLQASLIKRYTDVPVVEIVLTAQEMALLVMRARQIVQKPRPRIAVVGFRNMFCDMSYFDEIYEIELRTYYVEEDSGLLGAAQAAVEDEADLIIGGDTAVGVSTEAGIPSLFLSMTEDSMRQAFATAERVDYAMNQEKKSAAQMETLLDYSYSGIIRLNAEGRVLAVNSMMEDIVRQQGEEPKGKDISELVPEIDEGIRQEVLKQGKERTLLMDWNHVPVFIVMAPVLYDGRVDSVILTCHRARRNTSEDKSRLRKQEGTGGKSQGTLPVLTQFADILHGSEAMKECVHLARLYALSEQPVVLMGEPGTERQMLAECIHGSSERRSGPFLDVPCEGLGEEEQWSMIFGEHGAALQAQGGTLLLQDVDCLSAANQYRLYQMIRFHVYYGGNVGSLRRLNVRAMVTVGQPLAWLAEQGRLRRDLYYLLSGLELAVPSLRERKEDLEQKLEDTFRVSCERYSRYHVMTEGAKRLLREYPWPGNLFQVESFFDRLVLTARKRSLDEIAVAKLLRELYPQATCGGRGKAFSDCLGWQSCGGMEREGNFGFVPGCLTEKGLGELRKEEKGLSDSSGQPKEGYMPPNWGYSALVCHEESRRIMETLFRMGGSREKTAAELGISKATLWRRMKKYGIEKG